MQELLLGLNDVFDWMFSNSYTVALSLTFLLITWRLGFSSKRKSIASVRVGAPKPLDSIGGDESSASKPSGNLLLANAAPCGPRGVVYESNSPEPCPFENDVCSGSYLFLHRPTDDPALDAAGEYPYSEHMHGRRRLWEMRFQFRFKRKIDGQVYFGVEQDRYYPVTYLERYLVSSFVSVFRRAAPGVYHSHGDDPDNTEGECELPGTVFPLWVVDQLVVTPEGEEPPRLNDPDFDTFGMVKAHDREAMRKAIDALDFTPGKTYSFGFWCVAQFVDAINWKLKGQAIVPETSLTDLATHPPCFATMYVLKPRDQWRSVLSSRDNRHLVSRKTYFWRVGFWSSLLPPPPARVREFMSSGEPGTPSSKGRSRKNSRNCGVCGLWW